MRRVILAIALTMVGTAMPASGQQRQSSGPGAKQHPLMGTMREAREARARRCEASRQTLQRKLTEVEQKQQRAHETWHRHNDRLRGGEWLRKHQSFHRQLQDQREQARRTHMKDCDDVDRKGGGVRDDDRWRKDRDALERERDRFRGAHGRGHNN